MFVIYQRMCYHRGREEERLSWIAWHAPDKPRQALTRLEGRPTVTSIPVFPQGSHRSSDDVSLHIASHNIIL